MVTGEGLVNDMAYLKKWQQVGVREKEHKKR